MNKPDQVGLLGPRNLQTISYPGNPGKIATQSSQTSGDQVEVSCNVPIQREVSQISAHTEGFARYLVEASAFVVKQKVEMFEVITGFETANKYVILDQLGNKVLYAVEQSDCLGRNCFGGSRGFNMSIRDYTTNAELLDFDRDLHCGCALDRISVTSESGRKLGSVRDKFTWLRPVFKIKDAMDGTVLKIKGPICPVSCCGQPVVFRLLTLKNVEIGRITKEWRGFGREMLTDADTFTIKFPVDLDPAIKAVCLAALFMIDFRFFER